jgi:hypothetical protein
MPDSRFVFRNSGAVHRLLERMTTHDVAELHQRQVQIMREAASRHQRQASKRPWWRSLLGQFTGGSK